MLASFLLATAILLVVFTALWAWCLRTRNASWVDVAWAYAMPLPLLLALPTVEGLGTALLLLSALALLWSLRLGTHLLRRVARHHPDEDSRYASLRARWGNDPLKWSAVFALQVVTILILSSAWLAVIADPSRPLDPWAWAGTVLVLVGVTGEGLADHQLKTFLARPKAERPEVCRVGLWGRSRHPNYFFESVSWWGFGLFALGSPWGILGLIAPLFMTFLVLKVTGVPPPERSSLRSKPDSYPLYQAEVSPFIPLPPKRGRTSKI